MQDGECLAITYLAKALHELGHSVTLLSMNTSKHRTDLSTLPAGFNHYKAIHTVDVDNHLRPWDALRNLLFSDKSYHIERFEHAGFAAQLSKLLQSQTFDVVHLETMYLTPYVPIIRQYAPKARIVMRSHNVEHEIWERIAVNSNPLKKWYLERITPRLKRYEVNALNDYDLFAAITHRDETTFRSLGLTIPSATVPIGIDTREYHPDWAAFNQPLHLSFIGALDWMPNIEGLDWFISSVWEPLIRLKYPEMQLHIAGRNASRRLLNMQVPGITIHGEVPDAAAFLNQYPVTIAPLLSGGGMRVKILEGMALGRIVLSTQVGIEGIPATHQQEALIADSPEEWLAAIDWCIEQGPQLKQIGESAQAFCHDQFDNLEIAEHLIHAYRDNRSSLLQHA